MTSSNENVQPRKRPFIVRLFLALIKLITFVLIVGGGIALGVLAFTQFNYLNAQQAQLERRLDNASREIQAVRADQTDTSVLTAQLTSLDQSVNDLEDDLNIIERDSDASDLTLSTQTEMVTDIEGQIEAMVAQTAVISESLAMLEETLATLQTDVSANSSAVTTMSGSMDELDGVADQLTTLQSDVSALTQNLATLQTLQAGLAASPEGFVAQDDVLTTFRVWGLIARARLYLTDGNVGFAQTTVESAQVALALLIENSSDELATALTPVQGRLDEAAANLPADPEVASRSLDSAWESVDLILSAAIGPSIPPLDEAPDSPDSEEGGESDSGEEEGDSGGTVLPVATPEPGDDDSEGDG